MTAQQNEPDPNANTASGQTPNTNPASGESENRRPSELFAAIDKLEQRVGAMPDAIIEALKQHGGVTKQQEDAVRQTAAQDQSDGTTNQSPSNPTDQKAKKEDRGFIGNWWYS